MTWRSFVRGLSWDLGRVFAFCTRPLTRISGQSCRTSRWGNQGPRAHLFGLQEGQSGALEFEAFFLVGSALKNGIYTLTSPDTVDGRTSGPPKTPWNDDYFSSGQ